MSSRPDLVTGIRVKVPLIVAIPLGALALIAIGTIGFSRILLKLEPEAATAVALAMAVNILIACAIVANKPRLDSVTAAELFVVVTYPLVIGIVLAQIGFGGGGKVETAPDQAPAGTSITAADVAFDTNELKLAAGEKTTLPFTNDDAVEHNLSIYKDDTAKKELFKGQNVPAGASTEYSIPPLDKGEYFFRCDIHPSSMTGTVVVQ